MVAHDSATWLPSALTSLATLDPPPDRLVVVDNTPGGPSGELLQQAVRDGVVDLLVDGDPGHGFADAVAAGLQAAERAARAQTATAARAVPRREWIWLLHDDVVATPEVLGELLRHVVAAGDVDITGPTLLRPSRANQPRRLWDTGISVSGTGRAVASAETGEVLQGQLDRPERVLGLSTCGLLVRREVWDALGGLAPEVPVFRDGVELGWRATRAGFTVTTTPTALLVHRRVGRAGLRPASAATAHPAAVDRSLGMATVWAHRRGAAAALTSVRLVWGCLLRMVGFVLGKAPDRAADEWRALRHFLGSRPARQRLRQRVEQAPVAGAGVDRAQRLRPRWWHSLAVGAEWAAGAVSDRFRALSGHPDTSLDELTGDDFAGREDAAPPWWRTPLLLLVALVAVAGVFGRWVVPGVLTSTQLLPGPAGFEASWSRYLDGPEGLGPPWLGLLALLATPLGGHADWVVVVLLAGGVVLAWAAARAALRSLGVGGATLLGCATVWALLPTVLGAAQRGSLLAAGWAVALPLLVVAGHRMVRRSGLESTRGAFGVALSLLVLAALLPALLLPAAVLAAVLAWRRLRLRWRALVAVGAPLLLLSPWLPDLLARPGRALTGPDPVLAPSEPVAAWRLLLGQTPGAAWSDGGPVPLLVCGSLCGLLWLLALVALVRRGTDRPVLAGWAVALTALLAAVVVSRLVVAVPPYGDPARPEVTGWLLLGFGGLLVAAARGLSGLPAPVLLRRAVSVLCVLTLLGVGTLWWVFDGLTGPVQRRDAAVPAFIATAMEQTPVRTLAVELGQGEPRWNLLSGDGPRLGDTERGTGVTAAERDELARTVVRLVGTGGDEQLSARLAELGVGYLWVTGADPAAVTAIGTTPGLQVGSDVEGSRVWTVTAAPVRAPQPPDGPRAGVTALALLQLLGLLAVVVMAAPALSREDEEELVARRGRDAGARPVEEERR
nr:glycosyltransferase [Auraticoccus cholistanensis]